MEDIADLLEFKLKSKTPPVWAAKVVQNFDTFLRDHAAAEKKAMSTALSFIAKYPDQPELVKTMFAIAKEELEHFEQITALLHERQLTLGSDEKDPYIQELLKELRGGVRERFLDRLLLAAIVENRGCERFALVADALSDNDELKTYYEYLSREEAKHYGQYVKLARTYFPAAEISQRLTQLLDAESRIMRAQPIRPMLH